jgi:hypothetical protein
MTASASTSAARASAPRTVTGADLRNADLRRAFLTRAKFVGPGLVDMDLRDATLTFVDFTDARWPEGLAPPGGWVRDGSGRLQGAGDEPTSRRILACLLPVRPPRHRERRTKCRQQFPSSPAVGRVPASTGKAAVTIYPAGQITYADGRTRPAAWPGGRPAAADTS